MAMMQDRNFILDLWVRIRNQLILTSEDKATAGYISAVVNQAGTISLRVKRQGQGRDLSLLTVTGNRRIIVPNRLRMNNCLPDSFETCAAYLSFLQSLSYDVDCGGQNAKTDHKDDVVLQELGARVDELATIFLRLAQETS